MGFSHVLPELREGDGGQRCVLSELRCPYQRSCCAPIRGAAPISPAATPWEPVQHVSATWYLVPLFFGILGGIIAWAVTKDKDPKRARNLLIFGLVWTLVPVIIALAIFLYTVPFIAT